MNIVHTMYRLTDDWGLYMEEKSKGFSKGLYLLTSVMLTVVLTGILLMFTALLMEKLNISGVFVGIMIVVADCLPAFIAGLFLGKKVKEKRFLWGFLMAVLCFLLYLLLALIYDTSEFLSIGNYIRTFLLMGAGGMLGGMLS